jgi:hypothetical protein
MLYWFGKALILTQRVIQVYKGSDEILLSKLVLEPAHSILRQSFDSRLRLVSPPMPYFQTFHR